MKHICPHCKKPGVSNAALRWASRESPAQGAACGGLSHVLASTSSAINTFTCLTLLVSVVLGLAFGSLLGATACLIAMVVGNVWMWRRCELFPIDPKTAKTANRVGWAVTISSMVSVLFL